jgi:hypothetical protein
VREIPFALLVIVLVALVLVVLGLIYFLVRRWL